MDSNICHTMKYLSTIYKATRREGAKRLAHIRFNWNNLLILILQIQLIVYDNIQFCLTTNHPQQLHNHTEKTTHLLVNHLVNMLLNISYNSETNVSESKSHFLVSQKSPTEFMAKHDYLIKCMLNHVNFAVLWNHSASCYGILTIIDCLFSTRIANIRKFLKRIYWNFKYLIMTSQ